MFLTLLNGLKNFHFFFSTRDCLFVFSQVDGYSKKHPPYAKNEGYFEENLYHIDKNIAAASDEVIEDWMQQGFYGVQSFFFVKHGYTRT